MTLFGDGEKLTSTAKGKIENTQRDREGEDGEEIRKKKEM